MCRPAARGAASPPTDVRSSANVDQRVVHDRRQQAAGVAGSGNEELRSDREHGYRHRRPRWRGHDDRTGVSA